MRDMTFWAFVVMMAALVLLAPVGCSMHQNAVVRDMVAKGADPMRSACAIKSDTMASGLCAQELQR